VIARDNLRIVCCTVRPLRLLPVEGKLTRCRLHTKP
jgi:hypothetical protein